MILPIVLVVFMIMAILGTFLMFSGTSEYSQSALAAYGLRARELAMAGLDESRGWVYDQVNRPGGGTPPLKQQLYDQIAARVQAGDRGDLLGPIDLGSSAIPWTLALATRSGGRIEKARVVFYGFRKLEYDTTGLFANPSIFYKDPTGTFDRSGVPIPMEYQGYYRIEITARYGDVRRTLTSNHDVKVVMATPFARQFALFSYLPSRSIGPGSPPDGSFARNDLNRGGSFKVYPNREGRVFVRGPFVVESEGKADASGGKRPGVSPWYPHGSWWRWSGVPAVRDLIIMRSGLGPISFANDPKRPDNNNDSAFLVTIIRMLFGGLAGSIDPGYAALNGQQIYAEFRNADGGGAASKTFSIVGNPAGSRYSMYRGLLYRYEENAQATLIPGYDVRRLMGTGFALPGAAPGNDESRWVIEPEGNLLGVYSRFRYRYWETPDCGFIPCPPLFGNYEMRFQGHSLARYGMHWEKKYTQSWLNFFLGSLFLAGRIFLTVAFGFDVTTLMGIPLITPDGFLTGPGLGMILGTVGAGIGASLTNPDRPPPLGQPNITATQNVYPPDFRVVARSITRYYTALQALPSMQLPEPTLTVDGVIGFDDMSTDRSFAYQGSGVIYSDNPAPPTLTAPIAPHPLNMNDRVFFHYGGPVENAHGGNQMLRIRSAAGGGATVVGSVYSTQGVEPEPGHRIQVVGNLTCGFINKSSIPDNGAVDVNYDLDRLQGDRPEDFQRFSNGSWHVISVSHRMSGFRMVGGGG